MATTRIKDLSKTATTVNSDANLVLDGNTGGTQKISRDNFRQDTADAFVAAPGTYNLAPLNSGTGKIDAVYLSSSSDTPKGAWDASSNTPTLADGSGTAGDYYDVTVAGSSDLGSGSIAFTVGDVVKYNGTVWFKIDSVANILDGVSTIDGAKTAIEIPDVGTGPSQVPLNQHLGTMAYQDADGVSIAELQGDNIGLNASPTDARLTITDSTNDCIHLTADESTIQGPYADTQIRMGGNITVKGVYNAFLVTGSNDGLAVDSAGRVGIGTSVQPQKLTVQGGGVQIAGAISSPASGVSALLLDWVNSNSRYWSRGADATTQGKHNFYVLENDGGNQVNALEINASGLKFPVSGLGIDFGSAAAAGRTVESGLLDDYEEGSWAPIIAPESGSFASGNTTYVFSAKYTKIGNLVTANCYISASGINTSGGSNAILITGLPFQAASGNNNVGVTVGFATNWGNAPAGGYVGSNTSHIVLCKRNTSISGNLSPMPLTDLSTAASGANAIMLSVTYHTAS